MDERSYIARFLTAPPDQLVQLVAGASPEERGVLGAYLGQERVERLVGLALQADGRKEARGRVVFVPGFLGSSLTVRREGECRSVWLEHEAIRQGWFRWLRLAPDGRLPFDPGIEVQPDGVLNTFYAEVLLKLSVNWDVRAFAYDWRRDMAVAAAELEAFLRAEFGRGSVHVITHSSGALVARAMLAMRTGESEQETKVDTFISLGEPTRGTYVVPRILAGIDPVIQRIGQWSALNLPGQSDSAAGDEVAKAFASFPALYQLLPRAGFGGDAESDQSLLSIESLYEAQTYALCPVVVTQPHLNDARDFHDILDKPGTETPKHVFRIEGYGQPTPVGIHSSGHLGDARAYAFDPGGDGVIPARAGSSGAYFQATTHGGLTADSDILATLDDLIEKGETSRISTTFPELSGGARGIALESGTRGEDEFARLVRRLQGRTLLATRSVPDTPVGARLKAVAERVSPDERALEEMLSGDFQNRNLDSGTVAVAGSKKSPIPRIAVSLVHADIEQVPLLTPKAGEIGLSERRFFEALGECPIDSIAVGHYLGVLPLGPELALDRSISRALREQIETQIHQRGSTAEGLVPEEGLVLTQCTARGMLRGELGQPFFLNDPRSGVGKPDRLIVIAGMGVAGRFGRPELTVLTRELCWALGRLGKRHLATVLIGSGKGNMPVADAVHSWMQGLTQSLVGVAGYHPHLERITFVETDAGRIAEFDRALAGEVDRIADELQMEYTPKTVPELDAIWEIERRRRIQALTASRHPHAIRDDERPSTRVSVQVESGVYRFGAITGSASIPERRIPLKHWLVEAANSELATESDPVLQLDRGQFLGHLLIPDDLRPQFFTRDPLVLMLDAATARIHWEMMAQSEAEFSPGELRTESGFPGPAGRFPEEFFLGTARGLTRQLRTTFAPPPEPPPPPRRVLRVLVVADPAADAPLPGAMEEGTEVADLFESFNAVYAGENRVEVVRLIGPARATATNVLREVMSRSYDVFHFAGHCFFDTENPAASGLVFSGGQVLSADLLSRIDRVPKFVFSNACESGVTPDRPEDFSRDLAPSFAESFFQKGVSNFICTAWPVDDLAARRFARRLYQGLLGLSSREGQHGPTANQEGFEPMHKAMLEARLTIARNTNRSINPPGLRTWGAYQHYGDPFFRFFQDSAIR